MKKKYFLGLIYRVDNDLIYNKILNDKNEIGGEKFIHSNSIFKKRAFLVYVKKNEI